MFSVYLNKKNDFCHTASIILLFFPSRYLRLLSFSVCILMAEHNLPSPYCKLQTWLISFYFSLCKFYSGPWTHDANPGFPSPEKMTRNRWMIAYPNDNTIQITVLHHGLLSMCSFWCVNSINVLIHSRLYSNDSSAGISVVGAEHYLSRTTGIQLIMDVKNWSRNTLLYWLPCKHFFKTDLFEKVIFWSGMWSDDSITQYSSYKYLQRHFYWRWLGLYT